MTTFEHAMLGIDGALAAGLNRQHGWQVVALAGVAAVSPDWDGLTLLFSPAAFAAGHRVWGHNLLACVLLGVAIGALDYRFDLVTRCGRFLVRLSRIKVDERHLTVRPRSSQAALAIWILVAVMAALSQLPADMVVSGTATLPDWELQLLWPFSNRGWVFPMVRWGDTGITLVFVAGMFAMLKWPARVRGLAAATLGLMVMYIAVRGLFH